MIKYVGCPKCGETYPELCQECLIAEIGSLIDSNPWDKTEVSPDLLREQDAIRAERWSASSACRTADCEFCQD